MYMLVVTFAVRVVAAVVQAICTYRCDVLVTREGRTFLMGWIQLHSRVYWYCKPSEVTNGLVHAMNRVSECATCDFRKSRSNVELHCNLLYTTSYREIIETHSSVLFVNGEGEGGICVVSGFRREVDDNCARLGCYAASGGNFLPTLRIVDC
jgi:hypothetical protein